MHSPKSYQILEDNIDAEPHKENKEDEVEVTFDGKIFFCLKFSYSLNQYAEQSSPIQSGDRKDIK